MELEGVVRCIIYKNTESHYYVFKLQLDSGSYVTATGSIPVGWAVNDLRLSLTGDYVKTEKYGESFKFTGMRVVEDRTAKGIIALLQSSIETIGPMMASRLVAQYGAGLLEILDNTPDRLKEMPEFQTANGATRLATIVKSWQQYRHSATVVSFLMGHGLGPTQAAGVFEALGTNALERIRKNPYVLTGVDHIGFMRADKVALSMGVPTDHPLRLKSAIYYAISEAGKAGGHLYLTRGGAYSAVCSLTAKNKIVSFGRDVLEPEIHRLCHEMAEPDSVSGASSLYIDGDRIYTAAAYHYETKSAELLAGMLEKRSDAGSDIDPASLNAFISEYEKEHGLVLSEHQKTGVKLVALNRVVLITGLPGTGKTTVLRAVVRLFQQNNLTYALMAPTGIAAKRLSDVVNGGCEPLNGSADSAESTTSTSPVGTSQCAGVPALTIHRALRYKGGSLWGYCAAEPFPAEAVVVDECSMVDMEVFFRLVSAMPRQARLVLVGDPAQLPSVGPGNVLQELIACGLIPHVSLTEIFRQAGTSDIVLNAHRINAGEVPVIQSVGSAGKDFHFLQIADDDAILKSVLAAAKSCHAKGCSYKVISPRHAGVLGEANLNEQLKELLNPHVDQAEATLGDLSLREGDQVMVVSNNYKHGLYNGDMGVVLTIDSKQRDVTVSINNVYSGRSSRVDRSVVAGETHVLTFGEASDLLRLAYAITVHKSQGSEYEIVIMPFVGSFSVMLQRNLLYTAVTRAKKKVFIMGEWGAVRRAVANARVSDRNTQLSSRIVAAAV